MLVTRPTRRSTLGAAPDMQPNQRRLHPARSASPPFGSSGSGGPTGGVSFCVEGVNGRKPSQETRPSSASSASTASSGRQRGSPLGPARKPPLPKKSPTRAPGDGLMQREMSCSGILHWMCLERPSSGQRTAKMYRLQCWLSRNMSIKRRLIQLIEKHF